MDGWVALFLHAEVGLVPRTLSHICFPFYYTYRGSLSVGTRERLPCPLGHDLH
jgi:hypothetical protein